MAAHFSLATALDKNLLGSAAVYLMLLEVDIIDPNTGAVLQTVYATHNNEAFAWNGNTYNSMIMDVELTQDNQSSPSCALVVYDPGRIFHAYLQAYGFNLAWPVRFKVVNASNPNAVPEIEQDFEILSASAKDTDYSINFTLGAENPLTLRFPPRQQFPDRCFWKFKDSRCQYSGALGTCDYSYVGPNGCSAHSNTQNYGGFKGLRQAKTSASG